MGGKVDEEDKETKTSVVNESQQRKCSIDNIVNNVISFRVDRY